MDTFGATEGVSEGAGSGYVPSCYAEWRCSSAYAADAVGSEGCDFSVDPDITNEESEKPNFEPVLCFTTAVGNKVDSVIDE